MAPVTNMRYVHIIDLLQLVNIQLLDFKYSSQLLVTVTMTLFVCNCDHHEACDNHVPSDYTQTKVMKTAQYPSASCGRRVMIIMMIQILKVVQFPWGHRLLYLCLPAWHLRGRHFHISPLPSQPSSSSLSSLSSPALSSSSFLSPPLSSSLGHCHNQNRHFWRLRVDFHIYVHHYQNLSLLGLRPKAGSMSTYFHIDIITLFHNQRFNE